MSPNRRRPNGDRLRRLALAMLVMLAPAAALAEDAVLSRASGVVERGSGEPPAWRAAVRGDALAPGDRLRTGRDGRAELVWQGATIRLYGDSMLRLPAESWGAKTTGVGLEEGSGLFDVRHRESGSFEVHTPDVVVSVKGTRFGVDVDGGPDQVWVYRGTVGVRGLALRSAREVMVREGFRAVGGADGAAEVFLLDHGDPWSGWADTPPPRSADAAPPARRADDAARESVRQAAQDRALALTLARNPGLADRLKAMREELQDQTDRELKAEDGIEALEAGSLVDPVLDASTEDVELALKSRYIEQMLSSPSDLLKVKLTQNLIEVVTSSGQTYNFDPQTIEAMRQGSAPLPAGFDTLVYNTGEDPAVVMTLISELMKR